MSSYKTDKYKMRGMGGLLSLYGSACEEIEADYNEKKDAFLKAKKEYLECKNKTKRSELKEIMIGGKGEMDKAKRKMKDVLENVTEAIKSASKTVSKITSPKRSALSPKGSPLSPKKSPLSPSTSRILEDAVEEVEPSHHEVVPVPVQEIVEENDDIDSILSDDSVADMPSRTESERERKTMHKFFKHLGIGGGKMEQYANEQAQVGGMVSDNSTHSYSDTSSSSLDTSSDSSTTTDTSSDSSSDSY